MSPFLSYPTLQELQSFVHPEDIKSLSSAIMTHLAGESPKINVEFRIQQAGGQYIWVLGKGRLTKEESHSIRLSGSLSDITERKLAEDLLASVLDSSPNGVMALKAIRNPEGYIEDFEIQLVNRPIEQQSRCPLQTSWVSDSERYFLVSMKRMLSISTDKSWRLKNP